MLVLFCTHCCIVKIGVCFCHSSIESEERGGERESRPKKIKAETAGSKTLLRPVVARSTRSSSTILSSFPLFKFRPHNFISLFLLLQLPAFSNRAFAGDLGMNGWERGRAPWRERESSPGRESGERSRDGGTKGEHQSENSNGSARTRISPLPPARIRISPRSCIHCIEYYKPNRCLGSGTRQRRRAPTFRICPSSSISFPRLRLCRRRNQSDSSRRPCPPRTPPPPAPRPRRWPGSPSDRVTEGQQQRRNRKGWPSCGAEPAGRRRSAESRRPGRPDLLLRCKPSLFSPRQGPAALPRSPPSTLPRSSPSLFPPSRG